MRYISTTESGGVTQGKKPSNSLPAGSPGTRPSAGSPGTKPRPLPKPRRPVYEAIGGQHQQQQQQRSPQSSPVKDWRQNGASKLQQSQPQTSDVASASRRTPPPVPKTPRPVQNPPSVPKAPPPPTNPPPRLRAHSRITPVKQPIQSEPLPNVVDGSAHPLISEAEEPLSLNDFVTQHGSSLPLRVRVDKGFCGAEERCVISAGDVYNLHFIKRTRVVSMRDSGNAEYTIPLNSAIEFGPLYDPNHDFKEAIDGYMFDTVAEILALKGSLPKLLRVTRSHQGSDQKSSVREGELLIVRKASRTGALKRKPVLKVFSVTAQEEKGLFEDCIGQFTTHPYSAHTFLPEILQQLPDPFPMAAMLYISSETSDDLPVHLTSEVVKLTHASVETSLIATSCWEGSSVPSEEENIPIEIPIHLDIEIIVIPSEETQNQRLFSNTRDLYESFDPSKVMSYKNAPSGNEFAAQSTIYRVVRHGHEREGLELEKPTLVYENPALLKRPKVTTTHENGQIKTPPPTSEKKPSPLPASEVQPETPLAKTSTPPVVARSSSVDVSQPSDMQKKVSTLQSSHGSLKAMVDAFEDNSSKQFASIKAEVARLSSVIESTSKQFKVFQVELSQLKQQIQVASEATLTPGERQPQGGDEASVEERNRTAMRSLTHTQVGSVLLLILASTPPKKVHTIGLVVYYL